MDLFPHIATVLEQYLSEDTSNASHVDSRTTVRSALSTPHTFFRVLLYQILPHVTQFASHCASSSQFILRRLPQFYKGTSPPLSRFFGIHLQRHGAYRQIEDSVERDRTQDHAKWHLQQPQSTYPRPPPDHVLNPCRRPGVSRIWKDTGAAYAR